MHTTDTNVELYKVARFLLGKAEKLPDTKSEEFIKLSELAQKMLTFGDPFSGVNSISDFSPSELATIAAAQKERKTCMSSEFSESLH